MGVASSTCGGRGDVYTGCWWGNLGGGDHLEGLGINGDNIKMDFQEIGYGAWIGSFWLRIWRGGGHL